MKKNYDVALCCLLLGFAGFALHALAQTTRSAAAPHPPRYFKLTVDLKFGAVSAQQPATQTITTELAVRDERPGSCKARMTSQLPVGSGRQTRFIDLGTKLDCNDVHIENNALTLQFTLDASRIKDMMKTTAPDGTTLDEPLITQRTVQLTVKLPLNHTEVVFDSSTHQLKPLPPTNLQGDPSAPEAATLPVAQDVPLIIAMTATELP